MLQTQNRARRWNTDKFVTTCKAEWYELRIERAGNDLKIAELARKVRDVIQEALADRGVQQVDELFLEFVRTYFDGCRGDVMLRRAYSFDTFQPADWQRFGGWRGITFLMGLSAAKRTQVMDALPAGVHHTPKAVKVMARKFGAESALTGIGRPTREQTSKRLHVLETWAVDLYLKHPELPPPPAKVLAAMPVAARAKIMAAKAIRA